LFPGERHGYFGKLRSASAKRDSLLCIGLDPEPRVIGVGVHTAVEFCRKVIDSTSDIACCYKHNSAFWEQYSARNVYVVCHTSNPGRADLQHLQCSQHPLFMAVAELAMRCDKDGNTGVVMGATAPHHMKRLSCANGSRNSRSCCPAWDGKVETSRRRCALRSLGDPASSLVAVAGAIMYAEDPRAAALSWRDGIRAAAEQAEP
jgi:orotidine-5'-phosphate decarboxylase